MAAPYLESEEPLVGASDAAVWVLRGNRAGDNAMIEAVAEASGLTTRSLQLRFNPLGALQNLRPGGSLFTLGPASRASLAPPWPDVALTSGKRAVPLALWLKRASGGRTKLVHVGRPQAPLHWFDLVITTPQYGLPKRPNVVLCRLPATPPARFDDVVASIDLETAPRPHLVALAGGSAAPQILDADAARGFAREALKRSRAAGGSLFVATSPRTSRAAVAVLRQTLEGVSPTVKLSVFGEGPNRYRDFLATADGFLVTDESVSMVVEAAATGRPVALYRLPERPGAFLRAFRAVEARASLEKLVGLGLVRSNRDIGGYMRGLEADGLLAGGDAIRRLAATELEEAGRRIREFVRPSSS